MLEVVAVEVHGIIRESLSNVIEPIELWMPCHFGKPE